MPRGRLLHAGPLDLVLGDGELRHIRVADREILQRIYVAVRDRNWGTVPGRLENLDVRENAGTFEVSFDSIHQQGDIDYRWRGHITGAPDGTVRFEMDGKAHSTFLRNRIGFCVHHPLEGCAGKPCTIEKPDGRKEKSAFPEFVSPNQPFLDVAAMSHEVRPGLEAEVRFTGDIFETEDHRNWTDANFKTYGTPLRLPFPVEVRQGTGIRQSVELKLHGQAEKAPVRKFDVIVLRLEDAPPAPLPRVGLGISRDRPPLSEAEIALLRGVRPAHLRADIELFGDHKQTVAGALDAAKRLGSRLEAAIILPGPLDSVRELAPHVDRWLVFHRDEKATSAMNVEKVREALGPNAPIVAGTNNYFAELNRNRPHGMQIVGACFSVNPQVHAFDNESVMANTAGQTDVVLSARRFLGDTPVIVSPVTLRPRFNPDATGQAKPPEPDPRQKTRFCAAWTVASLKRLSEAGAAAVTYYELSGAGGVQDRGEPYPVYRVFEAIAELDNAGVVRSTSSDARRVVGLALASGRRRRLVLANLTDEPQPVHADAGPGFRFTLQPYATQIIDWSAS
jgi:hypothetical protein